MTHPNSNTCNDVLLNRYLDGDLDLDEKKRLAAHLDDCQPCRGQLAAMSNVARELRERVQQATDAVDFTALEKTVINEALRQRRSRGGWATFVASFKYTIPATVTAGLLLFFGHSHFMAQSAPVPSAIINSFTGSMSSVMIFETPETRQTILWYNEDTDLESEHNAV